MVEKTVKDKWTGREQLGVTVNKQDFCERQNWAGKDGGETLLMSRRMVIENRTGV